MEKTFQTAKEANAHNEAPSRERLLKKLRKKLVIDRQFLKQWLKTPRETMVNAGLSYTDEMGKYLPPALPEEYIDFSIKDDDENVSKIIDSLMIRVSAAIKEKTPQGLKALQQEGVYMKNGSFTSSAKEVVSALLQDPVGMLENAGIELTDEEKDAIFPPFSKINAKELTGWISMVQVDGF